jgi:phage gp45-like
MRENPAVKEIRTCDSVMLGFIQEHGVFFPENEQNPTAKTLVNVSLLNGWPDIKRVPVMTVKTNTSNGTWADPEPGDQVVVAFLNGNFFEPLVIGFLPPHHNKLDATQADAPRYHRAWQKTTETISKVGRRTIHVDENDILDVVGDGTVTIGGNLTTHIIGNESDTIDGKMDVVVTGNVSITSTTGIITLKSETTIILDTPLTQVTGRIISTAARGSGNATFNGSMNATGNVSDGTRSMAADRAIYNSHTHPDPQGDNTASTGSQE